MMFGAYYAGCIVGQYRGIKEQKAAQKQIESLQATIDLNEELVNKLKDQLPYQVADDQENTENKGSGSFTLPTLKRVPQT